MVRGAAGATSIRGETATGNSAAGAGIWGRAVPRRGGVVRLATVEIGGAEVRGVTTGGGRVEGIATVGATDAAAGCDAGADGIVITGTFAGSGTGVGLAVDPATGVG